MPPVAKSMPLNKSVAKLMYGEINCGETIANPVDSNFNSIEWQSLFSEYHMAIIST